VGLYDISSSELVGTIGIQIDFNNLLSTLGILIGNLHFNGKGYASESLIAICHYLFSFYDIRKVCAGVISSNEPSMKLFRRCGFVEEGLFKQHSLMQNGIIEDVTRFALFRKEP